MLLLAMNPAEWGYFCETDYTLSDVARRASLPKDLSANVERALTLLNDLTLAAASRPTLSQSFRFYDACRALVRYVAVESKVDDSECPAYLSSAEWQRCILQQWSAPFVFAVAQAALTLSYGAGGTAGRHRLILSLERDVPYGVRPSVFSNILASDPTPLSKASRLAQRQPSHDGAGSCAADDGPCTGQQETVRGKRRGRRHRLADSRRRTQQDADAVADGHTCVTSSRDLLINYQHKYLRDFEDPDAGSSSNPAPCNTQGAAPLPPPYVPPPSFGTSAVVGPISPLHFMSELHEFALFMAVAGPPEDDDDDLDLAYACSSRGPGDLALYDESGRRHTLRPPLAKCTADLVPVATPDADMWGLHSAAVRDGVDVTDLEKALDIMFGVEVPDLIRSHPDFAAECASSRHRKCRDFSAGDIDMVFRCRTWRKTPPLLLIPVFKVAKSSGGARLVADGRVPNRLLAEMGWVTPKMPLLPLAEFWAGIAGAEKVYTIDGTSWFYQMPISQQLGQVYGVSAAAKRGHFWSAVFAALPMGASFAPFVAQTVANAVCAIVKARVAKVCDTTGLFIAPWLDNFIIAGPRAVVDVAAASLDNLAQELNFVFKAPEWADCDDDDHHTLKLLGTTIDLRSQEVCAIDNEADVSDFTTLGIMRRFGTCMWIAHAVLRLPLCLHPDAMAIVRRAGRNGVLDRWTADMSPTNDERADLAALERRCAGARMKLARFKELTAEPLPVPEFVSWSDASGDCMATFVQGPDGDVGEVVCPADPRVKIFIKEFIAAAAGVYNASLFVPKGVERCYAIDATAVVGAFVRGHSRSRLADALLRCFIVNTDGLPADCSAVAWVASATERADPLTREGLPRLSPWTPTSGRRVRWLSTGQE